MKKATVISAFPCCGKSYAYNKYNSDNCIIMDSDSSLFNWITDKNGNKVRNPEFPNNYIEHVKENLNKADYIFVSSHLSVRQALTDEGISFITVYPKNGMLNEWVGRMYRRGNTPEFIQYQIEHWDEFVESNSIMHEPHGSRVIGLGNNKYLDNYFSFC